MHSSPLSIFVRNIRNIPFTDGLWSCSYRIIMIIIGIIDIFSPGVLYCLIMGSHTRDVILRTLRAQGRCTVKELAEAAQISPVSVRHHLSSLQAGGLIKAEEVKHGVGRPRHQFFLTEEAYELFPTRYFRLTNRILVEMKDTLPDESIETIFSGVADSMALDYAGQLAGLPVEERLRRLVTLLDEEGFEAEYEVNGTKIILRELSCPYYQIGQKHPEVCLVDQSFIAKALDLPVERVTCLLEGDTHCTYSITIEGGEADVGDIRHANHNLGT